MSTQDPTPFDGETGRAGALKTASLRERIAILSGAGAVVQVPPVEPQAEEVWDEGMEDTTPALAFPWEEQTEQEAVEAEADSRAFIQAQTGVGFDAEGDDPYGLGNGGGSGFGGSVPSAPLVFEDEDGGEEIAPVSLGKALEAGPESWMVQKPVPMALKREPPALPVCDGKAPRTGPNAPAARVKRTDDPSRYPIPLGGRDGRYIAWDLEDGRVKQSVAWLAWLDTDERTIRNRTQAASVLVDKWQETWGETPALGDILHTWWRAARRTGDVAAAAGMAGASPNAAVGRLMALNAVEFGEFLFEEPSAFAKEMTTLGLPFKVE